MRWHAAHRHWSSSNVQAVYPTKHSFDCFSLNCMQKLIFMIPTCALTQFTCYSHVDVVFICRQNWQTQLIFFRVSLHVCKKYWFFTILKVAQFLTPCCIPHSLSLLLVNSHIFGRLYGHMHMESLLRMPSLSDGDQQGLQPLSLKEFRVSQ